MVRTFQNSIVWIHLVYLGLLPAVSTFFLTQRYDSPLIFLVFLGGIVVVGTYLAATCSYTSFKAGWYWLLWELVDIPLLIFFSAGGSLSLEAFTLDVFLIEGASLWISLLILSRYMPSLDRYQRKSTAIISVIGLISLFLLYYSYMVTVVPGNIGKVALLVGGIAESTWLNYRLFGHPEQARNDGYAPVYIVIFTFLWIGGLISGKILYEISHS